MSMRKGDALVLRTTLGSFLCPLACMEGPSIPCAESHSRCKILVVYQCFSRKYGLIMLELFPTWRMAFLPSGISMVSTQQMCIKHNQLIFLFRFLIRREKNGSHSFIFLLVFNHVSTSICAELHLTYKSVHRLDSRQGVLLCT